MNFILKKYQEKAVKDLLSNSQDFIKENFDESKILFQSPTGSGKTVVVANFLERFITESNPANYFAFIWIAQENFMIKAMKSSQRYIRIKIFLNALK